MKISRRRNALIIAALIIAALVVTSTVLLEYHIPKVQYHYPIEEVIYNNATYSWTSPYFFNGSSGGGPTMPTLKAVMSSTSAMGQDGNLSTLSLNIQGFEYATPDNNLHFWYTLFVNGSLDPKMQPDNFSILYNASVESSYIDGTQPFMGPGATWVIEHFNTSENTFSGLRGNLQLYNNTANLSEPYHFSYEGQVTVSALNLQKNQTYSFTISAVLNGLQKSVGTSIILYIEGD